MTDHEIEIVARASQELLAYLDADAAPSYVGVPAVRESSHAHGGDLVAQVTVLPSIAARLAKRSNVAVENALDPPFEFRRIHDNPYLWFYRFGAVVLMSTAADARQRVRIQHSLGARRVPESDMRIALGMGETAKAAISDASVALLATHQNIAHLAFDLGMYATAMAIGRRYEAQLLRLSRELKSSEFDSLTKRALHTSRIAACRELRQAASELQNA